MAYDPVPDLAALVDGLGHAAAQDSTPATLMVLLQLMTGPYARLRGGLLLNEPGRQRQTTAEALTSALWAYENGPVT